MVGPKMVGPKYVKLAVVNAFSSSMLQRRTQQVVFHLLTPEAAREIAQSEPVQSAVGHPDTAALFSALLGVEVAYNRVGIALVTGVNLGATEYTALLLGQLSGPRLPPGTTELPPGAEVTWWLIYLASGGYDGSPT